MNASETQRFNARNVPLPTRCIDVTGKKLYLRHTSGDFGMYITLSHRWSDGLEAISTTESNFEARKAGHGFGNLPKNFVEAIDATRKLGVRYIWIDSICIIQRGDKGKDWREESTKMAQYYQQSILTLASTGDPLVDGIFCRRTSNLPRKIIKMPYRDSTGTQNGSFYIYRTDKGSFDNFKTVIRDSELFQRGWVFQEWLLSRRIVLFTPAGVFFECQSSFPRSVDGCLITPSERAEIESATDRLVLGLKLSFNASANSFRDLWYRLVEQYSRLNLTKADDRIVALAGVAEEYGAALFVRSGGVIKNVHPRFHTDNVPPGHHIDNIFNSSQINNTLLGYAAGTWIQDLHYGLLWEPKDNKANSTKFCEAPSWSWASYSGQVVWPRRSQVMQKSFKLLDFASDEATYHLVESNRWMTTINPRLSSKRFIRRGAGDDVESLSEDKESLKNMFTTLRISGVLQPILVRAQLDPKNVNSEKVRNATGRPVDDFTGRWTISSPSSPEIIGGWTTLEGEHQVYAFRSVQLYALHISTRKWTGEEGFALGHFVPRNDVHDILVVSCVGGETFRRIGVGQVFEINLVKGFKDASHQEITLV
jgi:hypothetical protein